MIKVLPVVSLSPHVQVSLQSDSLRLLWCTRRPFTLVLIKHELSAASSGPHWARENVLSDTITFHSCQKQFGLSTIARVIVSFHSCALHRFVDQIVERHQFSDVPTCTNWFPFLDTSFEFCEKDRGSAMRGNYSHAHWLMIIIAWQLMIIICL